MDPLTSNFVGLWLSADHSVRKMLLPNGRYIAMLGDNKRHEGEYRIAGNRIAYQRDGEIIAEGEFVDGMLRSSKMVLYAEGFEEIEAA